MQVWFSWYKYLHSARVVMSKILKSKYFKNNFSKMTDSKNRQKKINYFLFRSKDAKIANTLKITEITKVILILNKSSG